MSNESERADTLEATAVWMEMPEEFIGFMFDDGDDLHALHIETTWDDDDEGSSIVCLHSIGIAEVEQWHARMGAWLENRKGEQR